MTVNPTGRRHSRVDQTYLVVSRSFNTAIDDVWAALTDSNRTARWFGPWQGDPAGGKIWLEMTAEEGDAKIEARILECDAPRRLVLETGAAPHVWHLEVDLIQREDAQVSVELSHRLSDPEEAGQVGPGWEFYLDRMVAAETGGDPQAIAFETYYPAQAQYYKDLFTD